MPVKAVLFDFDGVVVDSEPLYVAAETRLFEQYGVTVPAEDWKYFKGTTEADFFQLIRQRYNILTDSSELIEEGRRYIKEEFRKGLDYLPGFTDFRRKIEGRFRTALVTSTSADFLRWVFANTVLENRFDLTITADDVQRAKPHPEPYIKAMQQLKVAASETVIIEDSINGISAAVASGAITIGFLSSASPDEIPRADFYARNYTDISAILDKIAQH